jgi:hypothetical protein
MQQQLTTQELQNIKRDRLLRLAQVFQRANSVLALRPIKVHIVNQPDGAPAWSGANDVFFNEAKINDEFDTETLLSIQGLDFHELAHVRYTPRNGSEICLWVIENNYWKAFNALEDQRIETLMVGRFPSTVNWLTATVAQFILNTPEAIEHAYPLLRGRRYLPLEIRQLARKHYAKQENIVALGEVIDEYRLLLFPDDTERAKELIARFAELLQGDNLADPNGHESRPFHGHESSDSRPAPKREQQRDQKNAEKQEKELDKEDTQSSSADSDSDDSDSDEEDSQSNSSADNSADDSGDDSDSNGNGAGDSDSDDDSDSKEDSDSSSDFGDVTVDEDSDDDDDSDFDDSYKADNLSRHAGAGGKSKTANSKEVTDTMEEIIQSVTEELMDNLNKLSMQVVGKPLMGTVNAEVVERAQYQSVSATADLVTVQRSFARELERLKANYDPSWETEKRSGKLNAKRYMQGASVRTLFDKWQSGRDDVTAIEAVILLDRSSSMQGHNAKEAYKSLWAIKRSLDKVQASTTVYTFDSHTHLLYSADEKADTTIRDSGASGTTQPEVAILNAQNILANTDKPIRILFMITDGAWGGDKAEESVRRMKEAGVLTCQALLYPEEVSKEGLERCRHNFEIIKRIGEAKDILSLGQSLVRTAIARRLVSQ